MRLLGGDALCPQRDGAREKGQRGQVFHGRHMAVFDGPDGRFLFRYRWEMSERHRGQLCVDPITIDERGQVQTGGSSDWPFTVPVEKAHRNNQVKQ